jgi:hypothetical protein
MTEAISLNDSNAQPKKFWTDNRKLCLISMIVPTIVFWALMHAVVLDTGEVMSLPFLMATLYLIYPIMSMKYLASSLDEWKKVETAAGNIKRRRRRTANPT